MTKSALQSLKGSVRWAPAIALVAIAVWGALQPFRSAKPTGPPAPSLHSLVTPQTLSGAHAVGAEAAPAGLILYSDFECPYCARLAVDVLPTIQRDYVAKGLLRVGFRHFPIASLHPGSAEISSFVECASLQVDFWRVHDVVLANPTQLDPSRRMRLFNGWRLNEDVLTSCVSREVKVVEESFAHGKAIGIRSTPTILLGSHEGDAVRVTKVFDGFVGSRTLADAIDQVLVGQVR